MEGKEILQKNEGPAKTTTTQSHCRRLCFLLSQEPTFKHDDALKQVDCIMTVIGVDEEILYSKSHALQV